MKILSISAQKPSSTGSGVFLTELVREFAEAGHTQAVVAGIYNDDVIELPTGVSFHPVYYKKSGDAGYDHSSVGQSPSQGQAPDLHIATDGAAGSSAPAHIPFPICGMSDEMPYESTRYCDMTPVMVRDFTEGFLQVIRPLIAGFDPDLIICHHLYLLTAIVRREFPGRVVFGFCHNTDLRQMKKNPLERDFIFQQIGKLDHIFVPQTAQEEGVLEIFKYPLEKITRSGMGYNSKIFYDRHLRKSDGVCRLIFVGKIAEKKGLFSLIRALKLLPPDASPIEIIFAGSAGNEEEYKRIRSMADASGLNINFIGRVPMDELAGIYSGCDIFLLPSFCEGIPLTVIEALSCGCRVVMTRLPGIPEWIDKSSDNADIIYVDLPELVNTDEAVEASLPAFEERLSQAICESIKKGRTDLCDVSRISWAGIASLVLDRVRDRI